MTLENTPRLVVAHVLSPFNTHRLACQQVGEFMYVACHSPPHTAVLVNHAARWEMLLRV